MRQLEEQAAAGSVVKVVLFTVLREPLGWVVSAYNYMCGGGARYEDCSGGNGRQRHVASNLLVNLRPNPQCDYLM
jgi:hypothetical protein